MAKQKENLFLSKFHMLNSQENNEEINWSTSSASSDYEICTINEKFSNITNRNRKRKRKKMVPKNISNLDVTIINVQKDRRDNKSPILSGRCDVKKVCNSPILTSIPPKNNLAISPILISRNRRSPILVSKSPSPNVKKKLFKTNTPCKDHYSNSCVNKITVNNINKDDERGIYTENNDQPTLTIKDDLELHETNNLTSPYKRESSFNSNRAQIDLVNKVKTYFDSHFSSENASQNSISDLGTPNESSKTSDEIEILSCKTQLLPKPITQSIKQEDLSSVNSSNEHLEISKKKVRYKKDGLAYRLNNILKKQTANISLWQHERYLAENSCFIIPKEEHIDFLIKKMHFKYGCYLLETSNINNDSYLILINSCNVSNSISCDFILKLYAPYKILDFTNNYKLIINVYKFECLPMKK